MIFRAMRRSFTSASQAALISDIKAREIFDSRGNPTVEVELSVESGTFMASVPSGFSTGTYEALELRDKDPTRLQGKGVFKAVNNINNVIKPALVGRDVRNQAELDMFMVEHLDGSSNEWGYSKSKLGANAILAVSLAMARAGAKLNGLPLYKYIASLAGNPDTKKYTMPIPSFNIINGGEHAGNKLHFQEFMITPIGAKTFKEAMVMGSEIYHTLQKLLKEKHGAGAINVGDEGGFGDPSLTDEKEALEFIMKAIDKAGHSGKVKLATDIAASEFYIEKEKLYNMGKKTGESNKKLKGKELQEVIEKFCTQFPIISVEDPFYQNDFESYANLTKKVGKHIQIVGDDLLGTNPQRIKMAIEKKLCNALLLKMNQIGSLTETIEAYNLAKKQGWNVMVSHRSGETEDPFIADLAVGLGAGQIKTGAPCRSDRMAKYNQLLRIEDELKDNCEYRGKAFRAFKIKH
eukprot:TRINITY_DN135080_c2_g1_i1.p2 TRINITY_DN135080_c2_g1~~TRINITY_DN135080_c2_g1_i1.p2  ORF type:complete len:463 (+),score=74.84 TRINITY_DN135080_c2_g1_i1:139-1527(+)